MQLSYFIKIALLTIILGGLIIPSSEAQLRVGFSFGLNNSHVHTAYNSIYSAKTGMNAGIVFQYQITHKFSVVPELIFSMKGYNNLIIPAGTTHNMLNYLCLPLLAHYQFSKIFSVQLGPSFNYLLNASTQNSSGKTNISDQYKKTDLDMVGGATIHFSHSISLGMLYNFGLVQIRKQEDLFGFEYNRMIQANLSFLF